MESTTKFSPHGADLFGNPIEKSIGEGPLAARFLIPPFSVLNAREGEWQERKRAWLSLGIKSEVGRGGDLHSNGMGQNSKLRYDASLSSNLGRCFGKDLMKGENKKFGHTGRRPHAGSLDERAGREPGTDYEGGDAWVASANGSGTSIFDPVLCELAYRWFCPPSGQIVDPFAGGSVRGIVASMLGYQYHGIDLRPEQISANELQRAEICPDANLTWVCGDSLVLLESAPAADFVFSCPPYGDLERYSDDPRDLSTMEFHTFVAEYKRIILRAVNRMKPNRFACFVVGDFRDGKGHYRNFVSETIAGFIDAGCKLYNEAILVTAVGSLPIRIGKQFSSGRKLGKTHQNILVFLKGDAKKAAVSCGNEF